MRDDQWADFSRDALVRELERCRLEWHTVFNGITEPVFEHDSQYRLVRANEAYLELAGAPLEAVVGRPYWTVFPRLSGPLPDCCRVLEGDGIEQAVEEFSTADGRIFVSRSYPICGDGERRTGGLHFLTEVTAKRRAERDRQFMTAALQQIGDAVVLADIEGQVRYINAAFRTLFGNSAKLLGLPLTALWRADRGGGVPDMSALSKHGGRWSGEVRCKARYGRIIPVQLNVTVVRDDGDKPIGYAATLVDLTAIKTAQEALRHREHDLTERVKEMACLHDIAALAADPDLPVVTFCRAVVERLPAAFQHPALMAARIELGEQRFAADDFTESPWCRSVDIADKSGHFGRLAVAYKAAPPGGTAPFLKEEEQLIETVSSRVAAVLRNRAAGLALQESEARLRTIIEAEADAIMVVDEHGRIRYANPAAQVLLGRPIDELIDSPLGLPMAADNVPSEVDLVVPDSAPAVAELRFSTIDWAGAACHLVVLHDVTQRKSDEKRVLRLNRIYRLRSENSMALVAARSEPELLDAVCRNLVEIGGYFFAWIGFGDSEKGCVLPMAHHGALGTLFEKAVGDCPECLHACDCVTYRVVRSGVPEVDKVLNSACENHWLQLARQSGCHSIAAFPLCQGGSTVGAISVYSDRVEGFDEEELAVLTELTADVSFGIHSIRTEAARRAAEETLQLRNRAIEASRNGILIVERRSHLIIFANPAFAEITGYSASEVVGKSFEFLFDTDRTEKELRHVLRTMDRRAGTAVLLQSYRKDKRIYWNDLHISPVRDHRGETSHYVFIINDVTEYKQYEQQLEYQANHDELTGLPNRNLMRDRLYQALVHARRHQAQIGVLFMDLDQFKVVNDGLGHAAGDELLKVVAARIMECVREGDTVARQSGDEFVVILTDVSGPDEAAEVAKRISAAVARPINILERELQTTLSIGISLFPRDGEDGSTLLRNADAAMYLAKDAGRNTLQFYTAELNARMMQRLMVGSQLRRALENGELCLHFQPQVDLKTRAICGLEALVRWQHPELGLTFPNLFIPVAEENGLIVPLGEWVLREACRQARRWQDKGLPRLVVAVNVSARQLERDFPGLVARILEETGLDAGYLELELTESAVMRRPDEMISLLSQLKSLGIRLTIDDFGTGYSSLAYLKRFPFDKLKIDQSFVHDITTDPNAASIVLTVIAMANSMHLRVIAEGVEKKPQLDFLTRQGCDEMQGYYFARPLPVAESETLICEDRHLEESTSEDGRPTLLLVDDEPNITGAIRRTLRRDGYRLIVANSPAEAFDLLAENDIHVIVSDQRMPEMSGTEFLSRVKEIYPNTVRIILSGYTELQVVTEAVNRGAIYKFLTKPWDDEELRSELAEAFRYYRRQVTSSPTGAN